MRGEVIWFLQIYKLGKIGKLADQKQSWQENSNECAVMEPLSRTCFSPETARWLSATRGSWRKISVFNIREARVKKKLRVDKCSCVSLHSSSFIQRTASLQTLPPRTSSLFNSSRVQCEEEHRALFTVKPWTIRINMSLRNNCAHCCPLLKSIFCTESEQTSLQGFRIWVTFLHGGT